MTNTFTMEEIEARCEDYQRRRAALHDRLLALDAVLQTVKRRHLRDIKRCTALVAEAEASLRAAIDATPELFEKPKTQIFHGIKVGYRKGKGGLDWEDDDGLVRRIEKMFPDREEAERYLNVKKAPSAEALQELDAATLKRLGVAVVETGEQIVIKPEETAIEKLVKALLKDARDEAEAG